jgi:hypothetical protein
MRWLPTLQFDWQVPAPGEDIAVSTRLQEWGIVLILSLRLSILK